METGYINKDHHEEIETLLLTLIKTCSDPRDKGLIYDFLCEINSKYNNHYLKNEIFKLSNTGINREDPIKSIAYTFYKEVLVLLLSIKSNDAELFSKKLNYLIASTNKSLSLLSGNQYEAIAVGAFNELLFILKKDFLLENMDFLNVHAFKSTYFVVNLLQYYLDANLDELAIECLDKYQNQTGKYEGIFNQSYEQEIAAQIEEIGKSCLSKVNANNENELLNKLVETFEFADLSGSIELAYLKIQSAPADSKIFDLIQQTTFSNIEKSYLYLAYLMNAQDLGADDAELLCDTIIPNLDPTNTEAIKILYNTKTLSNDQNQIAPQCGGEELEWVKNYLLNITLPMHFEELLNYAVILFNNDEFISIINDYYNPQDTNESEIMELYQSP